MREEYQITKSIHYSDRQETETASVKEEEVARFGTFNGVFKPTILTILGVMMYLREGWVVGNAGLAGAILVILSCYLITGTTALSISSITTNIRVGSGGVFSIISQSLGLEVGGSVGVPLYLAQGLSAALYMQGIIEAWTYMFPEHPRLPVTLVVFALAYGFSSLGARLAFRVQVIVMAGAIFALASMAMGMTKFPVNETPILWGSFSDEGFLGLFAVFFPAATGIMVGSSMSGSLRTPRTSIPRGTLGAWGLSLVVYLSIAVWYALMGSPEELRDTSRIFAVERAFWGPAVLIGVISSCFSATLSSLVAAPRVLQALGTHRAVPYYAFFKQLKNDEPRNASLFTACLALLALLLGDLNMIAKILTMFFLVIYFMINLVLFIEHRLKMISFRPVFAIWPSIPIIGSLSCFLAILIISPLTGFLTISFAVGVYAYLDRKQLETPWETVHSGIFAGIANWAARKVITSSGNSGFRRSWKPDLLVPIERSAQLEGYFRIMKTLIYPQGSVQVASFFEKNESYELAKLNSIVDEFRKENIFATSSILESSDFMGGLRTYISVKGGAFFKPNTIFTTIENRSEEELQALVDMAKANQLGVIFLGYHADSGLGLERTVNLWVRDQSPNWNLGLKLANLDYAVLMSYQLKMNWNARVRVLSVVRQEQHVQMARDFIENLMEYARFSKGIEVHAEYGNFAEYLKAAPRADLNIMGLSEKVNKKVLESMVAETKGSCLFVLDSGVESALA